MSVVSLENRRENTCVDCEVRLLKLMKNGAVIFVSLKNPSELHCILLVNKYVKTMSAVSL